MAALLLPLGCGQSLDAFLTLPSEIADSDDKTALFARARGDDVRFELRAMADGQINTPVYFLVPEEARLYVTSFDATLDELQAQEGIPNPVVDGPFTFEGAQQAWSSAPTANGVSAWTEADNLPSAVRAGRFGTPLVRCPGEDYVPHLMDTPEDGQMMVAIGSGQALATTIPGTFYLVDENGITRRDDLRGLPHRAGHVSPAGRLWLAGDDGIYEGRLGEGFTQTYTATQTGALRRLTGDPNSERPELFALTADGRFLHITDTAVRSFDAFPGVSGTRPQIMWLSPGEAVAFNSDPGMKHFRDGRLTDVSTPNQGQILSLANIEGIGLLASIGLGDFYVFEDANWVPFPGPSTGLIVTTISEVENGFVFGGAASQVAVYDDRVGFCPFFGVGIRIVQQSAALTPNVVAMMGERASDANQNAIVVYKLR